MRYLLQLGIAIILMMGEDWDVGVGVVKAYPTFADKIPNGRNVPHPGPQGGVWAGVGHVNAGGGGPRNPFGLDFKNNSFTWTIELCEMDSDGDGRSNGEELGDPNCIWMEGEDEEPPEFPALSHPGIVDEPREFAVKRPCEDYVPPEDEITMDIMFSAPVEIDETRTHYVCEQRVIDVPAKELLHKIKHGIILDNSDILHHMFVFICPEGTDSTDGNKVGDGYYSCSGNESGCQRIGGWAVGPPESCEPPSVGEELDFTSLDTLVVKLEAHYDNVLETPQQDQSGMRIAMTPTLRPLQSASMMVGKVHYDNNFVIPPKEDAYPLTEICPTAITQNMERPAYAYSFTPHMHTYGKLLVTEHYRCGVKIGEVGRINDYEFDNQQSYALDPPIKILPGDSFVTTCEFKTADLNTTIMGGEETSEEMCLNFLRVYPDTGTETTPNLLRQCFAVENGFRELVGDVPPQLATLRFAYGGATETATLNFESQPEMNIADCCVTNNCEELYMADIEDACGVDSDCTGCLTCVGGLCASSSECKEQDSTTSVPTDPPTDGAVDTEKDGDADADDPDDNISGGLYVTSSPMISLVATIVVVSFFEMKLG